MEDLKNVAGKIFKAPKDGGFVCKVTVDGVAGYFHYDELKHAKLAAKLGVNVVDVIGVRRQEGVTVELTLSKKPNTYEAGTKTYLDVSDVEIKALVIK